MQENIIIFTDGSCLGNPGKWWYCGILLFHGKKKIVSGWSKLTTNNKMEMTAIIESLKKIKNDKYPIEINTDSMYIKDWITQYIHKWVRNWRKKSDKEPVKNKELWQELYDLTKKFEIKRNWVKWHSDNQLNNEADEIAREVASIQ